MTFLLRWPDPDVGYDFETIDDEALALARVTELYEHGYKAELYQQLPIKLAVKARIIKRERKSPAPVSAEPPAAAPGAGESTVCLAPGCTDPAERDGFCPGHYIKGIAPETAAALRKSKANPSLEKPKKVTP